MTSVAPAVPGAAAITGWVWMPSRFTALGVSSSRGMLDPVTGTIVAGDASSGAGAVPHAASGSTTAASKPAADQACFEDIRLLPSELPSFWFLVAGRQPPPLSASGPA